MTIVPYNLLLNRNVNSCIASYRFEYWKNQLLAHITIIAITAISILTTFLACLYCPAYTPLVLIGVATFIKVVTTYIYLPIRKKAEASLFRLDIEQTTRSKIAKFDEIKGINKHLLLLKEHKRCGALPLTKELEKLGFSYDQLTYFYARIETLNKIAASYLDEIKDIYYARPSFLDVKETIPTNFTALQEVLKNSSLHPAQKKALERRKATIEAHCDKKYLEHLEIRMETLFLAHVASNPLHQGNYSLLGRCTPFQSTSFFTFKDKNTPALTTKEIEDIDKRATYELIYHLLPFAKLKINITHNLIPCEPSSFARETVLSDDDDFSFIGKLVEDYYSEPDTPISFHDIALFFKDNYRSIFIQEPKFRALVHRYSSQLIHKEILEVRDPTNLEAIIFGNLEKNLPLGAISNDHIARFNKSAKTRSDKAVRLLLEEIKKETIERLALK